MENSETGVWLDFAVACKYINAEIYAKLTAENEEIGKLLYHMINNPEKY
jgi:four helix bundle protein